MKKSKFNIKNIVFIVVIGLLLIPKTRQPIQVFLNKGLALFGPSIIDKKEQVVLTDYNWDLMNVDGNVFHFEKAKGKVVFLNFWATWCPPCIAEMPSMQKLFSSYKDQVEFIFISNEAPSVIDSFLKEKAYTFKVYNPVTKYPDAFDVSSIPRTFVLDKSGRIVIDKTGAANWDSKTVKETIDRLIKRDN